MIKIDKYKVIYFIMANKMFSSKQPRKNDIKTYDSIILNCDLIANCMNNVFCVYIDKKVYYFREVRKHIEKEKYVIKLVNDFFESKPELYKVRDLIIKNLSMNENFNNFWNMGLKRSLNSKLLKYIRTKNLNHIGLQNELYAGFEKEMKEFIFYMYSEIHAYKLNYGVKKDGFQTYNATRSICTKKIANLLSLDYLIPEIFYCELNINGTKKFGTLMEMAPGENLVKMDLESRKRVVTPELLKQLTELNILDAICNERDHRLGNYFVTICNGRATGVCAFDNDAPMTLFPISNLTHTQTYVGCSPILTKDGLINRIHMPLKLAEAIKNLSFKDIFKACNDYLGIVYSLGVWERITRIKRAINATASIDDNFLIAEDAWSQIDIEQDVSGKYGKTYLMALLNYPHRPKGYGEINVI